MNSHLPIEDTDLFRKFEEIARAVWDLVSDWKAFAQQTVGRQLVRAIDSVGANLVEGDGRYSAADALHFFVIARGSARESQLWIRRAIDRRLIDPDTGGNLLEKLNHALRSLNSLISFRRGKANMVRESRKPYGGNLLAESDFALYWSRFDLDGFDDSSPPEHLTPNTEHLFDFSDTDSDD